MKLFLHIVFFSLGLVNSYAQDDFNYKEIFKFDTTIDKTKWRLPNHDSIQREFINYLKKTSRYYGFDDDDGLAEKFSDIYSIRFSHDLNLVIYETGTGISPLEFYAQGTYGFNYLGVNEMGPEYLKNILYDENDNLVIITYSPPYLYSFISESIWKEKFDGLYLYKRINSQDCVELPEKLLANPIKAMTLKDINALHEAPKTEKAKCSIDSLGQLKSENTFSFFQKNSICTVLAESKDSKGKKWYYVEIGLRDAIKEYRYKNDYNDFYIGWMKSSDLKLLK